MSPGLTQPMPATPVVSMFAQVSEFQRVISDQFQKGGSLKSVLLVVAGIVGLVLLVYLLTRRQERRSKPLLRNDPQLLFVRLLAGLKLPRLQREVIESVARAARPAHPTAILLSEDLFDRAVTEWQRLRGDEAGPNRMAVVDAVRRALFPH